MRKICSLKGLQAFEAAARKASFSAAATELSVTTSAVSHQIKFLEKELGVELFHRTSRVVTLTDAGERIFQGISEAFDLLELSVRDVERSGRPDILTIHSVPSFATQWLMHRISDFRDKHGGIDVRLNASVDHIDLTSSPVDIDIDIRYGKVLSSSGIVTVDVAPST